MPASQKHGQAYAFESITVSNVAIGLTAATVDPTDATPATVPTRAAFEAFISVETNPVRYRMDGTDPDASTGHLLAANDTLIVTGTRNLQRLKFIRSGGSDGTVRVTYFR